MQSVSLKAMAVKIWKKENHENRQGSCKKGDKKTVSGKVVFIQTA